MKLDVLEYRAGTDQRDEGDAFTAAAGSVLIR